MLRYQIVYSTNGGLMNLFTKEIKEEFTNIIYCYNRLIGLYDEKKVYNIRIYDNEHEIPFSELLERYNIEISKKDEKVNDKENENNQSKVEEYKIQILYENNNLLELGIEKDSMRVNINKHRMLNTFKNSRRDNDFFIEYEILARSITMLNNLKDMEHIKSFMNEIFSDSIKKGNVTIKYF